MKMLAIIELFKYLLDIGVLIETLNNAKKHSLEMDMLEFLKQLFWGKGYYHITPPQLSEKLKNTTQDVLIVDLREKERFEKGKIQTAISYPFDLFLKNVLIDRKFEVYLEKEIVLVCDTGHMSRVAGAILAEEGFKYIYSLNGGMRRWRRWQNLLTRCDRLKYEKSSFIASFC